MNPLQKITKNDCRRWGTFWVGALLLMAVIIGCNRSESMPALTTGERSVLRVATFNIHHANPPDRPGIIDIKAVVTAIEKMDVDLVALQEVDVHTQRSGVMLHQAKKLAQLTGMNYFFQNQWIMTGELTEMRCFRGTL